MTGVINYVGGNVPDAAAIETALRNLPNLSDSVTVRPAVGTTNEVQRITFVGGTASGTFVLAHAGLSTAPITFAGLTAANGVTTANNIQTALRALPNLSDSITVAPAVVGSATEFVVTFAGPDGGIDQPLLFLVRNNLNVGTAATFLNSTTAAIMRPISSSSSWVQMAAGTSLSSTWPITAVA